MWDISEMLISLTCPDCKCYGSIEDMQNGIFHCWNCGINIDLYELMDESQE